MEYHWGVPSTTWADTHDVNVMYPLWYKRDIQQVIYLWCSCCLVFLLFNLICSSKYTRYSTMYLQILQYRGIIFTHDVNSLLFGAGIYLQRLTRVVDAWQRCWETRNCLSLILGNEHTPSASYLPHELYQSCICRNWYQRTQEGKGWVKSTRMKRTE